MEVRSGFGKPTARKFVLDSPPANIVISLWGTVCRLTPESNTAMCGLYQDTTSYLNFESCMLYEPASSLVLYQPNQTFSGTCLLDDRHALTNNTIAEEPKQITLVDGVSKYTVYNNDLPGVAKELTLVDGTPNEPIGTVTGSMTEARFKFNANTYIELLLQIDGELTVSNLPLGFVLDGKTIKGISKHSMTNHMMMVQSTNGSNIPIYFTVPTLERIG